MTENDYVATATAEKRLREVLAERMVDAVDVDHMATLLLDKAEITYLPRKKSVSITLRIPETATVTTKPDTDTVDGVDYPDKQSYDEAQLAKAYDNQPIVTPEGNTVTPIPHKQARFGEFQPTVTSAPEYHEDDYFTE